MKRNLGYRVLSYVDDFAIAPSLGRAATAADCRKASRRLDELLLRYGLMRHPSKGIWGDGSQCLEHLGFVIDTRRGFFGVPASKLEAISSMARQLMKRARRNRRLIRSDSLESFIGKAQSLRLAVPDTAFRLRALYDCVPAREAAETRSGSPGKRYRASPTARLSHPALKDLRFWGELPQHLRHSRIWQEMTKPTVTIHTDASMSAYGATLAHGDHDAGTRGYYECRGYWQGSHKEIAHITMLELTTV